MTATVTIRPATAADADVIAALHAASWRAHYRSSLSAAYLDGPVVAERVTFWRERFAHPRPGMTVFVAEDGDELRGFVCGLLDHDRQFGTLIDNLHVAVGDKRRGLGRRLMLEAGEALQHALPRRPISLTVLLANTAAQAFYDAIGGQVVERARKVEPDGSEVTVLRYGWDSPAALIAGCRS